MTGQTPNEVMSAMAARIGGIDIRDGNFSDAVIACVWEHDAILKLREGDPEFKDSVGVGYVWYSKDEDAWHTEREKTLKSLNQNSVSELCDELVKQGALFDISRPNIDQITRTDAVANCAGRLRVRGATKVIVFLQSAAAVVLKKPAVAIVRPGNADVFDGAEKIEYIFQPPSEDNENGAVVCSVTYAGRTWMQADVESDPREVRMRRALQDTLSVAADNLHRDSIIAQGTYSDEEPNN